MSQNTQAGPVPTLGDASNVPADMLALANALGPQLCPAFATTAARDTAATSTAFVVCTVAGVLYRKNGSAWEIVGSAGPWVNLTLTSGFQVIAGNTLKVRKLANGDFEFHGWVGPTSGNFATASTKVASMPAGFTVNVWTTTVAICNPVAAGVMAVEFRTDGGVYVTPTGGIAVNQCRIPVTKILAA